MTPKLTLYAFIQGTSLLWSLFLPPPLACQSPRGLTLCGEKKKRWPNQAASQIEAALCLIRTTSERVERARGKEKQNETDD